MRAGPVITLRRVKSPPGHRPHFRVLLEDDGKARRVGWIVDRAGPEAPAQWASVVRPPAVSRFGPPVILVGSSPEALRDEIAQMYAAWATAQDI